MGEEDWCWYTGGWVEVVGVWGVKGSTEKLGGGGEHEKGGGHLFAWHMVAASNAKTQLNARKARHGSPNKRVFVKVLNKEQKK